MKFIRKSSEDEMIATFLLAELESKRFKGKILDYLSKKSIDKTIITNPDLRNNKQNIIRKNILKVYRGYGRNSLLFENFPSQLKWEWISLSESDIRKIKYINYSYWVKLSNNTRLAKNALENIRKGVKIFNQGNRIFLEASKILYLGKAFPPLILVSAKKGTDIVVLEGHLRLTTYLLNPKLIPPKIKAIIGYSGEIEKWNYY